MATSGARIRAALGAYAPITAVTMVREGDLRNPMAILELDLGSFCTAKLALRLDGWWRQGKFLRAHQLLHP